MTFAGAKEPLCALVTIDRNSQMTAALPLHPNATRVAQWSFCRGGIVQRHAEINERLTAA